jgi:hypothetical protein
MQRVSLILVLSLLAIPGVLPADVLLIEQVRQAEGMAVPQNGQSKAEVEAAFGAPETTVGPVGDPPITRWTYQRWTVYFEFDHVLFTVLNKGEVITSAHPDS